MMNKFYLIIGLLIGSIPGAALAAETGLGQANSFGELVSLIWSYGAQLIMGGAVFFIVLGAFFYVLSAGNEERVTTGKQLMWGALVAILIVLFSGVLIRVLHRPAEGATGTLAEVPGVLQNATNILTGLIGAFAVLMLTYAGFLYATGRGNADTIEKAHRAFRYAVYGLGLGLLAYTLVNTLVNYFI